MEIARVSDAVEVIMRSNLNSDDFATLVDVMEEVLLELDKDFDNFCCILPSPFAHSNRLREFYELLLEPGYDSVFPVIKYSHPIQRALEFKEDKIQMIHSENTSKRTQDLTPTYHDAGQFYWMNINSFHKYRSLFTKNSGAIVISELENHDIDTEEDWKIAEIKYELSKSN